nr:hypothetical protein [Tanacetum cinerariifolium]
LEERDTWDRDRITWGGWDKGVGIVPMGASVRECRVGEKGFWRENGLGTVRVVMGFGVLAKRALRV